MPTDQEIKQRIASYATENFLKAGFKKVTMDELAVDLGISKKTLYKFFSSKEDLLRYAVRQNLKNLERDLSGIVSSPKNFIEKLASIFFIVGQQMSKITRVSQMEIQKTAPDLWEEIEEFRRKHVMEQIGTLFQQGRTEGIIREDVDPKIVILMLLASAQNIVNPTVLMNNSFSAEDVFRTVFRVIFEGALTDEARVSFEALNLPFSTLKNRDEVL